MLHDSHVQKVKHYSGVRCFTKVQEGRIMVIKKGKTRRFITLSDETWEYLERRVSAKKSDWLNNIGQITCSTVLEELALSDKKLREAFDIKT